MCISAESPRRRNEFCPFSFMSRLRQRLRCQKETHMIYGAVVFAVYGIRG